MTQTLKRLFYLCVYFLLLGLGMGISSQSAQSSTPSIYGALPSKVARDPFQPSDDILDMTVFVAVEGRWMQVIDKEGGRFHAQHMHGKTFMGFWVENVTGDVFFAMKVVD